MADIFAILAEARIREWQRRREAGEPDPPRPKEEPTSLEGQLLRQILELLWQTAEADDERRKALNLEINQLEMQLMMLLESNAMPLAARRISEELQEARAQVRKARQARR